MTEYTRRAVAGIQRKAPTGKKPQWIPAETVAEVMRRITAGEYRCDIARSAGVSEYSVTMIAKRHRMTIAVCPRGTRWGRLNRRQAEKIPPTDTSTNWRAVKAAMRWGGFGVWR